MRMLVNANRVADVRLLQHALRRRLQAFAGVLC
jgi:hypothetical protein